MKLVVTQYRNKNDFRFGSLRVRTGAAWLEIHGTLKSSGNESVLLRFEWRPGKGREYVDMEEEKG